MTGSVLIHVQYLLGIGHLQRARRIGEALAGHGVAVTLVSGGSPVPGLAPTRRLRVVQLPPIRALDARFDLVDADGAPVDDAMRETRRRALLDAFAEARPDVVVIEGFPFARRAFRFELDLLIEAARQARARLVCSVRDIVNPRDDPTRSREIVARVRADFDAVLVHGDPALVPFQASFPAAGQIADRLHYTGYVGARVDSEACRPPPRREVLVSAGGGPAGYALLQAAVRGPPPRLSGRGAVASPGWRRPARRGIRGTR